MLNTKNIEYICEYIAYIKEINNQEIEDLIKKGRKTKENKLKIKEYFISNELKIKCNLDDFLNKRFCFFIGREYQSLEEENKKLLCENGFSKEDVNDIVFPNAIQIIAALSVLKDDGARNITREELLTKLKSVKKTAISRWTRELSNYKVLLSNRKKQLRTGLNVNYRKRCFIFDPDQIENFE